MELQLEDYWKMVRPQRAKSVGVHRVHAEAISNLVRWVSNLSSESKPFQVVPENNGAVFQHLKDALPVKDIEQANTRGAVNLVEPLVQLLRDKRVPISIMGGLEFNPPSPIEWELLWCLVACPYLSISSSLLDFSERYTNILSFYTTLTELRFDAREHKVLIAIEEGIQRLVNSISKKRRDRLNILLFMLTLACENQVLDQFIVRVDTQDTTSGLLELIQAINTWSPYGCPLHLLIECQSVINMSPVLQRQLLEGLEWVSPS